MAGGKKNRRGGTAKKKQTELAQAEIKRNTAFIQTSDGPERVLPLEVRKEIYRYLLLGRHVKKQRDNALWNAKGPADYYDFQVNILRANKAIHAEAREILYGENVFAVLSTKEHNFPYRIRLHALPIVSESFAAINRFSEHSLYMRFEGPHRGSPGGEHLNCECIYCRSPAPEKRMLLLSDDLPAFFRICRVINHTDPDPTFFIVDQPRDGTFGFRRLSEKREDSSASIRFSNNTYGLPSTDFVARTLAQLCKVAGDRHVEIDAPSHPRLAAECKDAMMPKVVWGYAIAWDLVEVARELKAEADVMVRNSSADPTRVDKLAMMLYDGILIFLGNSLVLRRLGREASTFKHRFCKGNTNGCKCLDWTESWSLLNLDLAIACSCLNLFSGSDEEAEAHMMDAFKFMLQCSRVPVETTSHAHHVTAFMRDNAGDCRAALMSLKIAQTERQMAGLELDEGLEQDLLKHVRHMKTKGKKGNKGTDSCRFLCCSSFSGKTYVARDTPFDGVKPAGILAWQDHDHQLTEKNLEAMGLTKNDVPPRVKNKPSPSGVPSEQMEAMQLGA